jgi:pyruvate formate lyase activating enzyme
MWKLDIEDVAALDQTEGRRLLCYTPEQMVSEAMAKGCRSIASTYNEPTVSSEFSYQVFKLAKSKGLLTVYVTNGFESVETLNYLGPYLDAVNIDLKAFREPFYADICGAHLEGVCDTIRRCVAMGIHTEVTTLVIPGENDSGAELRDVASFLASVDPDIPWHVSAYHDDYKFEGRGRTPAATLERARKIGRAAGLKYVYMGNVNASDAKTTYCPKCRRVLVEREWGSAKFRMKGAKCSCGEVVPGLWEDACHLKPKLLAVPAALTPVDPVPAIARGREAVLYGGMKGTARRFAEEVGHVLGFPVIDVAAAKGLADFRRVVFVVSTYGRGAPPKSAAEFWAQLAEAQAVTDGEFAVLGCGSSSYPATFCQFAKNLQQKMLALGFREVAPLCLRDELDKASDDKVRQWIGQVKFT